MTDTEQVINTEEILLRVEPEQPVKRRPGRPRKTENVTFDADGATEEPKPRRGRRPSKLNGDAVSDILSMAGALAAMMTQHEHWLISKEETKPYADNLAELLNRIPSKYVKGFVDMNGYVIIAVGLHHTFTPRIREESRLQRETRIQRANATRRNPYDEPPREATGMWDPNTVPAAD